jgi:hypothetical protein
MREQWCSPRTRFANFVPLVEVAAVMEESITESTDSSPVPCTLLIRSEYRFSLAPNLDRRILAVDAKRRADCPGLA